MIIKPFSVFILGALLVAGCGGGGSSNNSGSNGGGSTSNLAINTAPTAKLASSQTNANTLAMEVQNNAPRLVSAASALSLPLAISALPGGSGAGTIDCSAITGMGGSGTISYASNLGTVPTAGSSASVTFSSCMFVYNGVSYMFNGAASVSYTRYNSTTDYALLISYSNFSLSVSSPGNNYSYGPMTGSFTMNVVNGVPGYASNLADGSATDISNVNVVYSGTDVDIVSATYVYRSTGANGIIRIVFNNWVYDTSTGKPVSGTITVTGANGDTVSITANGASYTVTYTINGAVTSYTVNY